MRKLKFAKDFLVLLAHLSSPLRNLYIKSLDADILNVNFTRVVCISSVVLCVRVFPENFANFHLQHSKAEKLTFVDSFIYGGKLHRNSNTLTVALYS